MPKEIEDGDIPDRMIFQFFFYLRHSVLRSRPSLYYPICLKYPNA